MSAIDETKWAYPSYSYDAGCDAAFFYLRECVGNPKERQLRHGAVLDIDAFGHTVAVEMLGASKAGWGLAEIARASDVSDEALEFIAFVLLGLAAASPRPEGEQ